MADRRASLDLTPQPQAAREAREFVTATARQWGLVNCVDTVRLLTSELVTNGVLHARTSLGISMTVADSDLTVEVHDNDPRPPITRVQRADLLADIDELLGRSVERPADADERHLTMHIGPAGAIGAGRGLLLVETLADEWGVQQGTDGKSVWFRLSVA